MNVNLHHLELFYYTAKAKGISNAVKIIPYGIRQPAISQQLMKLEDEAGTRLFERKPFALTPAGERLYRFLSRFFDNIESELAMLGEDAPVGRKCDFLVQEINREINTIGSKCCGTEMTNLVITAKSELEKIREQIQNLE